MISYPLTPPENVSPTRISISTINAVAQSSSPFTFQSQLQAHDGDGWLLEITLPTLPREDAAPWIGFLTALRGKFGTFLYGDPNSQSPLGIASGIPLVKGASQTGRTLITDGWTPSTTGILLAGDYIQLGQRLYMVVQDADSNGSGEATLEIFPQLRTSPADNEPITTDGTKGLFKLTDINTPIYTVAPNKSYLISFSAVEPL